MSSIDFVLERRRAEIERHAENTARYAEAFQKLKSVGQGSIEFSQKIDFGLTFIEEPYMSYGCQIDLDELGRLVGDDPSYDSTIPPLPICSAFVTEWDQDENDFYIGAWVAARVWFPYESNVSTTERIEVNHHFSFKAVALKDVPLDVRD